MLAGKALGGGGPVVPPWHQVEGTAALVTQLLQALDALLLLLPRTHLLRRRLHLLRLLRLLRLLLRLLVVVVVVRRRRGCK